MRGTAWHAVSYMPDARYEFPEIKKKKPTNVGFGSV